MISCISIFKNIVTESCSQISIFKINSALLFSAYAIIITLKLKELNQFL